MNLVTPLLASIAFFFVLFAVLLYVTGGLCGLIYLRQWRAPALLGLLGCLSFLAVAHYTCRHLANRGRPLRPLVAWAYAFSYLAIFIALDAGITALLVAPLR